MCYYDVGICNAEALHYVEFYSHDQLKIDVTHATRKGRIVQLVSILKLFVHLLNISKVLLQSTI